MKRRLFNFAAALSLGLLLIVMSLAIRGSPRCTLMHMQGRSSSVGLYADDNGMTLVIRTYLVDRQFMPKYSKPKWEDAPPGEDSWYVEPNRFGFSSKRVGRGVEGVAWAGGNGTLRLWSDHFIMAPWWFLMLVSAALPGLWVTLFILRRRERTRKLRGRLCLHCGYDLRATPDRCPECGTETKPQPAEGAAA